MPSRTARISSAVQLGSASSFSRYAAATDTGAIDPPHSERHSRIAALIRASVMAGRKIVLSVRLHIPCRRGNYSRPSCPERLAGYDEVSIRRPAAFAAIGHKGWAIIMIASETTGVTAPEIDPQDALAAMLDVQRSMAAAGREMATIVRRLRTSSPCTREELQVQLEESTTAIAAYAEQIQYLEKCYRGGGV